MTYPKLPGLRAALLAGLVIVGGTTAGVAAATLGSQALAASELADVRAALKLRLPRTPVDGLKCKALGGLCEVVSKKTLFYVDRSVRYLVVGRVYDMETRADLTAARLLELNPDLLAAGGLKLEAASTERAQPEAPAKSATLRVAGVGLPGEGAISWGPVDGPKVIVLSDFQCGYCRRLSEELVKLGARVEERPISIFGAPSRKLSESVICASDPVAALHAAYAGRTIPKGKVCPTKGLDANEAFAKAHRFGGTPILIRPSDGAVLEGYRDAATIGAWLAKKDAR